MTDILCQSWASSVSMVGMRADRLLTLLLLLQNRGRMTAAELAAELGVSPRTIYRDIEALGTSGVPVYADHGPSGGYRLARGYRTRLTGLTDAEADVLFLTATPGPAHDLGLGPVLASAQLKLQAALPADLAERTRRVRERFHLDAPAWFRDADPASPHLATIAEAVWAQHALHAHYQGWRGETHGTLRPLGLVLKAGIWYLIAEPQSASEPGAVRTYRVSRFHSATVTTETFDRPPGFDLAAHWQRTTSRLAAARHASLAHLRLSPRAQRLLPMYFGAPATRALAEAGPPDADGWIRLDLPVESPAIAVGDLLRLGTEAEVLGPPSLREAVTHAVTVLAARYAG
jgi:predicted DNA-binding transcriptional regulator YafY